MVSSASDAHDRNPSWRCAPERIWYFRVIEFAPDKWVCRHGDLTFDTHREMAQAVDHIRTLAAGKQPAELFVHRLDGTTKNLGTV